MLPPPAAYTGATVAAAQIRKSLEGLGQMKLGASVKAVKKIYAVTDLANPTMRLVLGKDAITYVKAQQESVAADIGKFESWSEDLQMD